MSLILLVLQQELPNVNLFEHLLNIQLVQVQDLDVIRMSVQ